MQYLEISLLLIILIQWFYIVFIQVQQQKEKKDLLNRLMAKDYTDYQISTETIKARDKGRVTNPLKPKRNTLDDYIQR